MRSSLRGMVTELERVGVTSGSGEQYIVRCHPASEAPHMILDIGWVGFRYHETNWSLVKLGLAQDAD